MYQQPTSKKPHLTLKTKAFLDELSKQKAKPLYMLDYADARQVLRSAQTQTKMPRSLMICDIEDTTFQVGPNGSVDVRIYRPKDNQDKLPLIVYFHGGGWVMGDKQTHERLMRTICIKANIAILFVNYQPAPEGQYPHLLEENYAALEYIIQNASAFLINSKKVILAGDSVGGNIATVVAMMVKERKNMTILKQILLYPVTDASMSSPSYEAFENGPWLTKKAMAYFWDAYAPDIKTRKKSHVSPINATKAELKDLPPALIITDENDVLRDEGEAYADKLIQAGVEVTAIRYNGTIHDFVMLDGLADTAPAKAAIQQIINVIKETV